MGKIAFVCATAFAAAVMAVMANAAPVTVKFATVAPEGSMWTDVLKEIKNEESLLPPPSPASISDDDAKMKVAELEEKKHHEIIDELVGIAFSKNLASALKVAESFKNPHIIDEFHDTLADHYYQKLLDARKLK